MALAQAPARPVDSPVATPPRHVSWTVRVRVLFESTAFSWIVLGALLLVSASELRRLASKPAAMIVAVIPLAGCAVVAWTLRTRVRWLRLLTHGRATMGTLVGMRRTTSSEVNGPDHAVMTFSITTETGRPQEIEIRTRHAERVQAATVQRIFHDPADPGNAVAWRELPPSLSFDARGQLRPAEILGTVVWLLPPAIALLLATIGDTAR